MKHYLSLFLIFNSLIIFSQEYFPTNSGVKNSTENFIAFTNATIHIDPSRTIKKGTLLIQGQKIINAGKNITLPKNCIVRDLDGKHIYPSFIDIYTNFGITKPKKIGNPDYKQQYDATRKGYYWNDHIMPDQIGLDDFNFDDKKAKEFLNAGFGIVNTHQYNGIMRGSGLMVALNTHVGNETRLIDKVSTQHLSFSKSVTSLQSYPTSLMGAMALIRQMYFDSNWYARGNSKTKDLALEALIELKNLPIIFEANSTNNDLRADKLAKEFGLQFIIKGGGYEYESIADIKNTNTNYIIPINFPKPYDVSDPYLASKLNLSDMRRWNQAPSNLSVLSENGVSFALTTSDLKEIKDFQTNLEKAFDYGFSKEKALEALTTIPASILGKSNLIGTLNKGSYANFLITSEEIFDKKNKIHENWVQGHKNVINDINFKDLRGEYSLKIGTDAYSLKISGDLKKPKSSVKIDTTELKSIISVSNGWVNLIFNPENKNTFVRLTSKLTQSENITGDGLLTNGNSVKWEALKKDVDKNKKADNESNKKDDPIIKPVTFPNVAYGFKELPKQETILFKNVTIWTNESDGILTEVDLLVVDGKIAKIGPNLKSSRAKVINGEGKHLTSGIIDEHTHVGIQGGGNEAGHNSSAEVTIEDVINSSNIGIYRNLAGGVTTMQILHGSANPIGGQSAIVKLKWGLSSDQLLYENAPKFIKFALGENVKQSNWGNIRTIRYPQTRMGVEQLFIDYFNRAKEYDAVKKSGQPYRTDLELETLAEILNKERYITCHSYVQSEINMLMKVTEQFDFNVNTFTHILEGYKVADKMKKHGVGASTFSDWWSYKFEVKDAIPYNGAIMHEQGITVAFNSDDAEMSRRLNQEAAKAVKYGGVSEEEAWKFVTLNPAKLLHIDDKVGSIKVGKDADLVLWSDHPLSVYAKAEKTMIEGVIYYNIDRNDILIEEINKERNDLINMMLWAKNKGSKTQVPIKKELIYFECESGQTQF